MSQVPPAVAPVPAAPAPAYHRHAWGWPAGSIRAILALALLALMWAVVLIPHQKGETEADTVKHLPAVLLSLQVLMVLILVHFFTAHGKTIGRHISTAPPLGMPGGSIRFVLAAGYIGLCVLLLYNHSEFSLPGKEDVLQSLLLEVVVVLIAYFAGMLISGMVKGIWGDPPPAPYQDLEAWVAVLAMIGLVVVVLIHLINLKVTNLIPMDYPLAVLSGLIGLYFGARS